MLFQWAQLKHEIPTRWKTLISDYSDLDEENLYQNHHVIKELECFLPLPSMEIYSILLSNIINTPTSNVCFKKLFESTTLDWSKIYLLPNTIQ